MGEAALIQGYERGSEEEEEEDKSEEEEEKKKGVGWQDRAEL